jgi:predicted acetyltransferase
MQAQYQIRPINENEFASSYRVAEQAFNMASPAEQEMLPFRDRFEFDRSLAAFDGDLVTGTACAFSFMLAVPGAVVPAAGVSGVAVLPPHRRRGILRSLMTRQLHDVHTRGEALAVLWASEGGIYGRFGYGLASLMATLSVHRHDGLLARAAPVDPGIRLTITEPDTVRPELAKLYELLLPSRPGSFARNDRWWDAALHDPEYRRKGATPLQCLLAEDSSGARGYALYSASSHWDEDGIPGGTIRVRELMADGPTATAALWRDLLSRDLVGQLVAWNQPIDDPVLHMLADPRAARVRTRDGLWARLVNVPAALRQRRYAAPADLVIEVIDDICPWNNGRWRLRAPASPQNGPGGSPGRAGGQAGPLDAACERTSDPPDLTMPVAALGAAYLGGTRLGALAAAGVVTELRAGSLATASAALSWDPAPWCPMIF